MFGSNCTLLQVPLLWSPLAFFGPDWPMLKVMVRMRPDTPQRVF